MPQVQQDSTTLYGHSMHHFQKRWSIRFQDTNCKRQSDALLCKLEQVSLHCIEPCCIKCHRTQLRLKGVEGHLLHHISGKVVQKLFRKRVPDSGEQAPAGRSAGRAFSRSRATQTLHACGACRGFPHGVYSRRLRTPRPPPPAPQSAGTPGMDPRVA